MLVKHVSLGVHIAIIHVSVSLQEVRGEPTKKPIPEYFL